MASSLGSGICLGCFGLSNWIAKSTQRNCGLRPQFLSLSNRMKGAIVLREHQNLQRRCYLLKTSGGPLTRFALKSTVTSTRLAILMKGMPLSIP
jgi:hypothetical protein